MTSKFQKSAHLGVDNTFSGVIVLGLISKVLYLFSIGDDSGEDCLLIQVITWRAVSRDKEILGYKSSLEKAEVGIKHSTLCSSWGLRIWGCPQVRSWTLWAMGWGGKERCLEKLTFLQLQGLEPGASLTYWSLLALFGVSVPVSCGPPDCI